MHFMRFVFGLSVITQTLCCAAVIQVGKGAYTTDLPANSRPPSDQANNPAVPQIEASLDKPPQTHKWWSSLIWQFYPSNPYSLPLYAHPASYRARNSGIEIGYPTYLALTNFAPVARGHKVQEFHYEHARDLFLEVVNLNAPKTTVGNYSDWTVTAHWESSNLTLDATLVKGSPFSYYEVKSGSNVKITYAAGAKVWYNKDGVLGITANGHHYGVFAPTGSDWSSGSSSLTSSLSGKNYLSIAVLPDNLAATLEDFRKHAYAFVTDTKVEWNYDQENSEIAVTYKLSTSLKEKGGALASVPLTALYKHQWEHYTGALKPYTYLSPRGQMKTVALDTFTTKLPYNGLLPTLPLVAVDGEASFSEEALYNYVDEIYKLSVDDRWKVNNSTDTYWTGKAFGRIAQLIEIADQVEHIEARDQFVFEMKDKIQRWFDAEKPKLFYYNNTWKTLIGYPASYGSDTQLSDHHFHYGYYIVAAGIIAKYDPEWAQDENWGGMVNLLIKDVANADRSDKRFPFLRHYELYEGHSWANGGAIFGAGNNEESSSESINFAYGLILWGTHTKNDSLRDLGLFLYTLQSTSIPQYWFDVENTIFPNGFVPNTVGITWSNGGAYAIWWDGTVQEIHGINFLPVTSALLYLDKYPDYLKQNQAFMIQNNGAGTQNVWKDIHMSVEAMYDPLEAIKKFNSDPSYGPEAGETRAHTYHWIHNLNKLGSIDPTITADTPHYAVFDKNGLKTYVVYNPNDEPITVAFSSGVTLAVPAHELFTAEKSNVEPGPGPSELSEKISKFGEVIFEVTPKDDSYFVNLNYKINNGPTVSVPLVQKNGVWTYTLRGLKNNDVIDYMYIYESNDAVVKSDLKKYIFKSSELFKKLQF